MVPSRWHSSRVYPEASSSTLLKMESKAVCRMESPRARPTLKIHCVIQHVVTAQGTAHSTDILLVQEGEPWRLPSSAPRDLDRLSNHGNPTEGSLHLSLGAGPQGGGSSSPQHSELLPGASSTEVQPGRHMPL